MQSAHYASQSMCDDEDTYKAILGDVQQGVLLAIHVRNLHMPRPLGCQIADRQTIPIIRCWVGLIRVNQKCKLKRLTSQLWDEGVRSSYFLPVKMSMATKWHLA